MTMRPQAELFTETLEEIRTQDRESRKAWLRLQLKARVRRFVEEFRCDANDTRRPSARSPVSGPRQERP